MSSFMLPILGFLVCTSITLLSVFGIVLVTPKTYSSNTSDSWTCHKVPDLWWAIWGQHAITLKLGQENLHQKLTQARRTFEGRQDKWSSPCCLEYGSLPSLQHLNFYGLERKEASLCQVGIQLFVRISGQFIKSPALRSPRCRWND